MSCQILHILLFCHFETYGCVANDWWYYLFCSYIHDDYDGPPCVPLVYIYIIYLCKWLSDHDWKWARTRCYMIGNCDLYGIVWPCGLHVWYVYMVCPWLGITLAICIRLGFSGLAYLSPCTYHGVELASDIYNLELLYLISWTSFLESNLQFKRLSKAARNVAELDEVIKSKFSLNAYYSNRFKNPSSKINRYWIVVLACLATPRLSWQHAFTL